MFLFQAAIAGSHARWLDRAKERNTKKKSHKHKKPSPLHSIVRSEIERLFIKILYVLDDNRRSQLVWKDETQVDLRSENLQLPSLTNFSRCLTNLDTKRKQIWAPMRPLLVTKLWTGCSGQFFFHWQTIRKCQKIDLPVERKSAECEIGHWRKSSTYETPLVVLTDLRATKNVSSDFYVKFLRSFYKAR